MSKHGISGMDYFLIALAFTFLGGYLLLGLCQPFDGVGKLLWFCLIAGTLTGCLVLFKRRK